VTSQLARCPAKAFLGPTTLVASFGTGHGAGVAGLAGTGVGMPAGFTAGRPAGPGVVGVTL
jgi:hypothetical protein